MKLRKLLLLFLASVITFSCMKYENPGEEPETVKYVTLSLSANLDTTCQAETKTYMTIEDNVGKVKWSEGDTITIYNKEHRVQVGSFPLTSNDIKNSGLNAVFTFRIPEAYVNYYYSYDNYLFYGKTSVTYDLGKPHSFTIDAVQNYVGDNVFDDLENISFGYIPAGKYTQGDQLGCVMNNVFGILKVNIDMSNFPDTCCIRSVRLTDKAGNYLAGTFDISGIESGIFDLSHKSYSGGESFTIEKRVSSNNCKGGIFYFLVPPGSLCTASGFDIAIYTDDGLYGGKTVKNLANKTSITSGKITPINLTPFVKKTIPASPQNTANSYIIPISLDTAGVASIPAEYMGNGYQGNGTGGSVSAGSQKIEGAVSAEIIWQGRLNGTPLQETEVISNASYFVRDGHGYIGFNTSGIEGNALVAVKNSSGTILWSWHLWITSKDDAKAIEQGVVLVNQQDPSVEVVTIMDRNIGALSANPSDGSQSHGLAYQFGRKDPYMGSRFTMDKDYVSDYASFASISPATAIYCEQRAFTIDESIKYPYARAFPKEGLYWSQQTVTWGDASGNENTHTAKSLYDPCPAGWRTFEEANIAKVFGVDSSTHKIARPVGESYTAKEGRSFILKNNGHPVYFPGSGYSDNIKQVSSVGSIVALWGSNYVTSSGGSAAQANYLMISLMKDGTDTTSYTSGIAFGYMKTTMPVRCQKWDEPTVSKASTSGSPSLVRAAAYKEEELEVVYID